jgi:hypothetical protein
MKVNFTLIIVMLAGIFFGNSVMAKGYGMAGCGLGALAIPQNNFMQIFAATTNATYYNQTFAITTGTSNCTTSGVVKSEKAKEVFVHLNYESLEREMSAGKGEKLETLASLFGCEKDSQTFSRMAQNNFEKLFSSTDTSPNRMVSILTEEVSKNEVLKNTCKIQ